MYLTFGEVMMRVAPDGFHRFRQAMPGKVNVAASLAIFGNQVRYLTAVPDNPITHSLICHLRGLGLETETMLRRDTGRLGIYFLETGANQRSSNVIYDREYSAIALAEPAEYDFAAALKQVQWVHITGITPALSQAAFESTLELVRQAKQNQATVSCDLNYRKKLWRWQDGCPPKKLAGQCMSRILPFVDLVIANEEDAADVLDIHAEGTAVEAGRINAAAYEQVARKITGLFPNVEKVAVTLRESISANHNNWGGMLFDRQRDQAWLAPLDEDGGYRPYEIRNIVDRVGGGDSFAAGLIHALNSHEFSDPAMAIRFAVAASCLKHSIMGDFNYTTLPEVKALVEGQASGRVRR